jgi:hypothetical protein
MAVRASREVTFTGLEWMPEACQPSSTWSDAIWSFAFLCKLYRPAWRRTDSFLSLSQRLYETDNSQQWLHLFAWEVLHHSVHSADFSSLRHSFVWAHQTVFVRTAVCGLCCGGDDLTTGPWPGFPCPLGPAPQQGWCLQSKVLRCPGNTSCVCHHALTQHAFRTPLVAGPVKPAHVCG